MYDFFDAVVCISLRGATQRQQHMRELFRRIGLERRATLFVAEPSTRGGRVGCFESHIAVMRNCLADARCCHALIFEDDAVETPAYDPAVIANAVAFMRRRPDDWDLLQLGYSVVDDWRVLGSVVDLMRARTVAPNVLRTASLGLHAYCIRRSLMERACTAATAVLSLPDTRVPHVDKWLIQGLARHRAACVWPMQFDQRWAFPSSNVPVSGLERNLRPYQHLLESWHLLFRLSEARPAESPVAFCLVVCVPLLLALILADATVIAFLTSHGLANVLTSMSGFQ
jgi:hypothetical protein